jgi:hypothetical protein
MNWKEYDGRSDLKQGTIAIDVDGEFVLVGKINLSCGLHDEFTLKVKYICEDFVEETNVFLERLKKDFILNDFKLLENKKTTG